MGTEAFLELALASYRRSFRMTVRYNLATATPSFNSSRVKRGKRLQISSLRCRHKRLRFVLSTATSCAAKCTNIKVCSACKHGDDPGAPVQPHFSNFFDMIPQPLLSKLVVALVF